MSTCHFVSPYRHLSHCPHVPHCLHIDMCHIVDMSHFVPMSHIVCILTCVILSTCPTLSLRSFTIFFQTSKNFFQISFSQNFFFLKTFFFPKTFFPKNFFLKNFFLKKLSQTFSNFFQKIFLHHPPSIIHLRLFVFVLTTKKKFFFQNVHLNLFVPTKRSLFRVMLSSKVALAATPARFYSFSTSHLPIFPPFFLPPSGSTPLLKVCFPFFFQTSKNFFLKKIFFSENFFSEIFFRKFFSQKLFSQKIFSQKTFSNFFQKIFLHHPPSPSPPFRFRPHHQKKVFFQNVHLNLFVSMKRSLFRVMLSSKVALAATPARFYPFFSSHLPTFPPFLPLFPLKTFT